MSTRCQIDFVDIYTVESKLYTDRVRIYRHSDGYPDTESGVIPNLKKFLKWNKGKNFNCEYAAANFILWSKLAYIHTMNVFGDISKKHTIESILFPAHGSDTSYLLCEGVCNLKDFHSDIEYYYEVIADSDNESIKIKTYKAALTDKDKTKFHLLKTATIRKNIKE